MPGPRKNLTPLDMKMMGLTYNQGGILNFLGKQPEVTAPIRAQSHADSPPTQLAYITDAEKDLLVKSNIHGSMAGKPNPGPAGLESLDDWYITPSGDVGGGSGAAVSAWESAGMPDTGYSGPEGDYTPSTLPSGQAVAVNVVQTPEGPKIEGPQTVVGVPGGSFLDGQVVPPEEPITPEDDKTSWIKDAWQTAQQAGGVLTSIPVAFFKKLAHPTVKSFQDPNFLATMKMLFDAKEKAGDKDFKTNYLKDYEDLIAESYSGEDFEEMQDPFKYFDDEMEKAHASAVAGGLGTSVQQNIAPEAYYLGEDNLTSTGLPIMPQTTGGLEHLAGLDVSKHPKLAQMIFDARAELDRKQGAGGGGGGIADLSPVAQLAATTPEEVAAETPYQVTLPETSLIPNPAATTMATEPVPIDYSQWPQYQGYPTYGPAGGPVPNYVNQGLGVSPHFDYWNQIAKTFPGMR